jgi:Icc-related predicted phosphoesterase
VKFLAVSDIVLPEMQNVDFLHRSFSEIELLVSCGDMPVGYLDFIGSILNVPLFFVRGNHDTRYEPPNPGGDNLHLRIQRFHDYWFAGLEGSIRYNDGAIQYTEGEMFTRILWLMPRLLALRARRGYSVDVLVAHSPPQGIHDIPGDYAHRGFKSFHFLIHWGRPRYLIHGHVDTWDRRKPTETIVGATSVININPRKLMKLCPP